MVIMRMAQQRACWALHLRACGHDPAKISGTFRRLHAHGLIAKSLGPVAGALPGMDVK